MDFNSYSGAEWQL